MVPAIGRIGLIQSYNSHQFKTVLVPASVGHGDKSFCG
jgi:hypothetical protein